MCRSSISRFCASAPRRSARSAPPIRERLRAAVDNSRMARAVGMNVNLLFTGTFVIGCALAGLGGAIGAGILAPEPSYALT